MRPDPLDFATRVEPENLPEWMDEPCSFEDFRQCLVDLGQVNRLTLAYRPTLAFLDRVAAKREDPQPLRIVDVGSGGGDLLRKIEIWARDLKLAVHLVGIDLNPYAARASREFSTAHSNIDWVTGDAFSYSHPIDIVVSSLFTHHLSESEIVRFLAWSESVSRLGWFINDLAREPSPFHLFGLFARLMCWHRFVQHDGPVSFRRSFREPDWLRMAAAAGVTVQLRRSFPARLCVECIK